MLKKQVFSFPLLLSSGKNLVPIRCDHVWRESLFEKEGKTVQHQVAFPISHLVAIPFGTTQKSEICLMTSGLEQLEICHIHKIQKHGYVSTFAVLPWIVFCHFFLYWLVFPSSVFLHLNVCIFCRMSSDKALAWSVFHSRASSFRSQTSIFELQVGKWKQLLFEIGYMSHETTMAMI